MSSHIDIFCIWQSSVFFIFCIIIFFLNSWSSDLGYVQKVSSQVLQKCYQALTLFEQLGHVVETDRKVVLPDMSREWGLAMGIQEMLMLKNS